MKMFLTLISPKFLKILKKTKSIYNNLRQDKEILQEEIKPITKSLLSEYLQENKIVIDKEYINIAISISILSLNTNAKTNIPRNKTRRIFSYRT